jgi:hypothetical protein
MLTGRAYLHSGSVTTLTLCIVVVTSQNNPAQLVSSFPHSLRVLDHSS